MGDNYRQGLGVPKDEKRALELYTMAVEQDFVPAIYSLGVMYWNGHGTEQDVIKAIELFTKAAAFGSVSAIVYLKQLKKSLPSNVDNSTLSFTPSRTHCSFCGVVHNPPNIKVNPCSGCHCVFYCCKEHQIMDWKLSKYGGLGHKEICKQLQ